MMNGIMGDFTLAAMVIMAARALKYVSSVAKLTSANDCSTLR